MYIKNNQSREILVGENHSEFFDLLVLNFGYNLGIGLYLLGIRLYLLGICLYLLGICHYLLGICLYLLGVTP